MNETFALKREKRAAQHPTTTEDYYDDYAEGTDPTPLPNSTESNPNTTPAAPKPSTRLPTKEPAVTKATTQIPTKEPTTQPKLKQQTEQPQQSAGQGLSGEFGESSATETKTVTNEEVLKES